ncbi:hypothetical protein J6590_078283 [Homalodisca vitripennis]|nr:hypothetical protein J6590_078283 [Homalodisca vitripennis]
MISVKSEGFSNTLKLERPEDILKLDRNEIVVKLEKGEGTLKIEQIGKWFSETGEKYTPCDNLNAESMEVSEPSNSVVKDSVGSDGAVSERTLVSNTEDPKRDLDSVNSCSEKTDISVKAKEGDSEVKCESDTTKQSTDVKESEKRQHLSRLF